MAGPWDSMPLSLESGMASVPPSAGNPWASLMDPFERAAYRQREPVQPGRPMPGPQNVQTPEELGYSALASLPMMVPAGAAAGLVGRAVAAAPRAIAGGLAGAGLAASTGQAGENQFQWKDPNSERRTRMQWLDEQINLEATRKTPSAKGTQKARMDSLIAERDQLRENQRGEYNDAYARWQEQEGARIEAERPFREQYPTAYRMLPLAGWATSALGGLLGSKGGAPLRSALSGAVGGIPGSAAAAVGPTAYDAATLPTGSKYQKQAADWLADPNYWLSRVGPEVLTGMGLGATAGKFGSYIPRPGGRGSGPQPATSQSAAPAAAPQSSPVASLPSSAPPPGYVLREDLSRMYGYPVWMKP